MLQHDQPQINEQEPSSSDSSNSIKDSKRTGHGKNKIMVLCIINLWRRGQKFVYYTVWVKHLLSPKKIVKCTILELHLERKTLLSRNFF